MQGLPRWLAARLWRASGRAERNRREIYAGATGLRVATFHGTPPGTLDHLRRLVDWWREDSSMATPDDVDAIVAGRWSAGPHDRLLITFDDGLATNHDAARWLASAGVPAVFFIVPSLVDRTVSEFLRYHDERGVKGFPPVPDGSASGLSTSQVREIVSMGHRVGAHNFAHRDLGLLHGTDDLHYEIGTAIEAVGEVTGVRCRDFAIGFGQPDNVSSPAADYLLASCPNVYSCHRGLNVPGLTPRFLLRHGHEPGHPLEFTKVCLQGGADHRLLGRLREMERRVGVLPAGHAPLE